ncbi:MAG: branched-chain amino acid ABC transporter permease [Chloroflexi bacterium]|nr:branched-chain amino acid ABC transporter permease [Chloroflexota bacterium]
MSPQETVVLQQLVNGLSLGMMYALLALGFTMVYGIIELINFAHFNVFMSGTFFALWFLALIGFGKSSRPLAGVTLILVLVAAFAVTMLVTGALGAIIERLCLKPLRGVSGTAPMITTIGVSLVLQSLMLFGSNFANNVPFPGIVPTDRWGILGSPVNVTLKNVLLWVSALVLMLILDFFVRRTWLGKAMRATAQDPEAARMMGIRIDIIILVTFFIGSALAGAAALIFGLYYGLTSYIVGYLAGLRAFTAAVLGGIGNIPGAVLGGLLIGFVESLSGQFIGNAWSDAIIFAILIFVLVFRPNGLLGMQRPQRA